MRKVTSLDYLEWCDLRHWFSSIRAPREGTASGRRSGRDATNPSSDSNRSPQCQVVLIVVKAIRAGAHLSLRVGTGTDRDRSTSPGLAPSRSSANFNMVSFGLK